MLPPVSATNNQPPGVLPALRAATGEAHQRLEDAVDIERRLADPLRYRQLLEIFLGFYRPLERSIPIAEHKRGLGLDLSERRKVPWLEEDLSVLGLTGPEIEQLPDCPELPRVDTPPRAMGCLYVLEGATLGGRHISAMMARSAIPPGARRFFSGYGERTGERWREFVAMLERDAAGLENAESGAIIEGAQETFACLHRWFVRQCPADALPG